MAARFHPWQYAGPARIFHVADVCMLPAGRLGSRPSQSRIISPVPCFSWAELKLVTLISKRLWNGKDARDSSGIVRARQGHTAHHFFAGEIREPTVHLQPTGEREHRR